jgi:hypothetical protein
VGRSLVRDYVFPEQDTKLREETPVRLRDGLKPVSLERLDLEACVASVKFGPSAGDPPQQIDLIPGGPINNKVLRAAVRRVASDILQGRGRYATSAQRDIAAATAERLRGKSDKAIRQLELTYGGGKWPPRRPQV